MDKYLESETYETFAANLLSKAVRYQTVSYDKMADPDFPLDSPAYRHFQEFIDRFISVQFPRLSRKLKLEHVNHHGLLYTWEGHNPKLNPTVLGAHTDVVPVDDTSLDEWDYDPWSGEIAKGQVFGRGSAEGKHEIVGILEAIEGLIVAGFTPRRTLLLACGFDEELGGRKGAAMLAKKIAEDYSEAAVVVSGGTVQVTEWGRDILLIGVTEKGQMPTNVEIRAPGRHASLPVEHSAIGIMSEMVEAMEGLRYETYLSDNHPMMAFLTCARKHADGFPAVLKPLLQDRLDGYKPPINDDVLATEFVNNAGILRDPVKWILTTAKSVNVIRGGATTNALPEHVIMSTDVRIHIAENVQGVQKDISGIIRNIAQDHNLTFVEFDSPNQKLPDRSVRVWADWSTEPAKMSPSTLDPRGNTPWAILAGTSISVLGRDLIVTPGMIPDNTDARHYQGLSNYVYRYSPGTTFEDAVRARTVNESMSIKGHVTGVRWYSTFVRNIDEATFPNEE